MMDRSLSLFAHIAFVCICHFITWNIIHVEFCRLFGTTVSQDFCNKLVKIVISYNV